VYLTTLIETSRPDVYYGLIIAVYSAASTISGLLGGRLVDKSRRVKIFIYVSLTTQIIGNLLYVVHFSPLFPLVGRLIAGVGDSFSSVCSGEIIRLYNEQESNGALWKLASAYSIGFVFGPLAGLVFTGVEFQIGPLTFNYTNLVGVFIASLTLICIFVTMFMVSDCSLEFDMKNYLSKGGVVISEETKENSIILMNEKLPLLNQQDNIDSSVANADTVFKIDSTVPNVNTVLILKTMLQNTNMVFMFTASFFFMYCLFSFDVTLSLVILRILEWPPASIMIILSSYGVAYFVFLIIGSKFCTTNKSVYWTCIFCIVSQVIAFSILIMLKVLERNFMRDVILYIIFLIMYIFMWFIEEVLLRSLVAKMVPSYIQSFTEGLRNGCSRLSTIVAALTAPLAFSYIQYWSVALSVLTVMFLLIFLIKRNSFIDIVQMKLQNSISCKIDSKLV